MVAVFSLRDVHDVVQLTLVGHDGHVGPGTLHRFGRLLGLSAGLLGCRLCCLTDQTNCGHFYCNAFFYSGCLWLSSWLFNRRCQSRECQTVKLLTYNKKHKL